MLPLIITKFKIKLKKVIRINKKINIVIDKETKLCYIYYHKRNKVKRGVKNLKENKGNIHRPYNEFKGALRARNLTYANVARLLNISETAVGYKINGKSDFYISEVEKILNSYNLKLDIFLQTKSCEFNNII